MWGVKRGRESGGRREVERGRDGGVITGGEMVHLNLQSCLVGGVNS